MFSLYVKLLLLLLFESAKKKKKKFKLLITCLTKATKSLKNSTDKCFVNVEFSCCAVQLNELVNT